MANTWFDINCFQRKVNFDADYHACCVMLLRLVIFRDRSQRKCLLMDYGVQVLLPCPSLAVGQIGLARNEIPPPYGEFVRPPQPSQHIHAAT